eukprot:CAMPEP_0119551156 /NCGR_PEP_ID=MMETSP1352-20130426/4487_1 /TAXON_ID=265584 /ORGANISM="Stauroneis constricta, Strain CCMP1120" /LENGTH=934 /DNA_ID=CAMNT_0007597165 /DNA_START=299 /DNA_END=3103 /DNA_ORIENTATION=+
MSKTAALLCLAGGLISCVSAKAILGVDLGSLYMKVSLVQRGAPLEIVTNLHSKRKTEQMILFDQGSRFYGADASSLLARKPTKTPGSFSIMLGRDDEHPAVKVMSERHFPLTPTFNETRKGLNLVVDKKDSFTPEELTAMVFGHAKEITNAYGVEKGTPLGEIRDCVLTVPSFATQMERQALMDAAELANLNVLGLIDENTAAALNFGMDKVMEEPKVYLFYNLGASSLQVSLVKFHSYEIPESKYSKKTKRVGSIEVLAKAWDATLGGQAFDSRLVEFFADHFNEQWRKARKHDKDIRTIPRAMTKIRLQANKVKHVLSANQEIPVHMDSLYDDMTLSLQVSRTKFEELCADLMDRAVKPVTDALELAGLKLDDVDEIEMIGGGMRVPKIQNDLSKALNDKVLGMHINSDESMALGAAFYGANISTAFRVRHVGLRDVTPFAIGLSLNNLSPEEPPKSENAKEGDGEEIWQKQATMFKALGKVGVKKTIAFTHDQDVHCALAYDEADNFPEGDARELQRYNITGIEAFAKEVTEKGLEMPKVSLQFELSSSGIVELIRAEAAVEETYTVEEEVEVDDEDDEANETADAEGEDDTKKAEEATDESAAGDEENATDTNATEAADKDKKKKKRTIKVEKEKKRTLKRTLTVGKYYVGKVQPYSADMMEESKAKMIELDRKDMERIALEAEKNKVESYIYQIKNKLIDDEELLSKVSTEEQREELKKISEDAEEWLYDADDADLTVMQAKYAEISEPAEKVWFRAAELTARPEAIKDLQKKLAKVESLMTMWADEKPQVTEEERSEVLAKVANITSWIEEKEAEQATKEGHEEPAFTSAEVPLQTKTLERLVGKLNKKPKPKPAKKEEEVKTNETDDSGANDTEGAAADDAEEETAAESETKEDGGDAPADETKPAEETEPAAEEETKPDDEEGEEL